MTATHKLLLPYEGKKTLVKRRQTTTDIEREILEAHRQFAKHYDSVCVAFWQGGGEATARHLYDYVSTHFPYVEQPAYMQSVKAPGAIVAEARKGSDCKHYASFIVGMCEALRRRGYKIRSYYKFASYNDNPLPGHVFAVVVVDGKDFWVDPVPGIGGFNHRSMAPKHSFNKLPPMSDSSSVGALYRISGVKTATDQGPMVSGTGGHWLDRQTVTGVKTGGSQGPMVSGTGSHWLDRSNIGGYQSFGIIDDGIGKGGKGKAKVQKALQNVKKGAQNTVKKLTPGKKTFLKYSLSTSRNAYLVLLKLNVFGMATKIWLGGAKTNGPKWQALSQKWVSLGGNPKNLLQSVKNGVATHNKLHKKKQISGYHGDFTRYDNTAAGYIGGVDDVMTGIEYMETMHGITYNDNISGVEDNVIGAAPAAAAIIAAAGPVLLALKGILQAFGVDTKKTDETTAEAAQSVAEDYNNTAASSDPSGKMFETADKQVLEPVVPPGAKGHEANLPNNGTGDNQEQGVQSVQNENIPDTPQNQGNKNVSLQQAFADFGNFISNHKLWFIGGGIAILGVYVFSKVMSTKPKGRGR
jgi:hypothetical protein